jgi:hypothetical protein
MRLSQNPVPIRQVPSRPKTSLSTVPDDELPVILFLPRTFMTLDK